MCAAYLILEDLLVAPELAVAGEGGPEAVGPDEDEDDDVEELEDGAAGGAAALEAGDADVLDDDREHREEQAEHDRVEVELQVAQVLRVEHFRQRVDQLAQVEVVAGGGERREHADQAHQLAAHEVALREGHQREHQVQHHDLVDDDDAHQQQVVYGKM